MTNPTTWAVLGVVGAVLRPPRRAAGSSTPADDPDAETEETDQSGNQGSWSHLFGSLGSGAASLGLGAARAGTQAAGTAADAADRFLRELTDESEESGDDDSPEGQIGDSCIDES
ncbi:MAG: hypothetical protein ACE5E8_02890 [Acidimicrobiia bacterium]